MYAPGVQFILFLSNYTHFALSFVSLMDKSIFFYYISLNKQKTYKENDR